MENNSYKKIMIATDDSESARKAVNKAINLAKLSNAKVYAVYVISHKEDHIAYPKDVGWDRAIHDFFREEAKQAIAYAEEAGKNSGVNIEPVVLEGSPANELVDFAERNDIDLIVMGTLGKTGIEKFLLGSVAENVTRHSKKPVLVVR